MANTKHKVEKITVNQLEAFVDSRTSDNWKEFSTVFLNRHNCPAHLQYRTSVPSKEILNMIERVVMNSFTNNGTEYIPMYKDMMMKKEIIGAFTNITIPQDLFKFYDWENKIHIFDTLVDEDCDIHAQVQHVVNLINEAIEFKKMSALGTRKSKFDDLMTEIAELVALSKEKFANINIHDLSDVADTFKGIPQANIVKNLIKEHIGTEKNTLVGNDFIRPEVSE